MKILVGAPVRQDPKIFYQYLEGLRGLIVPEGVELDFCFVLDNSDHLIGMLKSNEYYALYSDEVGNESYVVDEITHHWTNGLVGKIAFIKNALLKKAVEMGYDYFFLVDSDLVLHPLTLVQLIKAQKDLIANVFWTSWQPESPELPNAWDLDHYSFYEGSLEKWRVPGVYQVGMTGACFLISRKVIEAGVSYTKVPNLSFWGEDRHFCVRAACAGFSIWLETTYPAKHLYRKSDLGG